MCSAAICTSEQCQLHRLNVGVGVSLRSQNVVELCAQLIQLVCLLGFQLHLLVEDVLELGFPCRDDCDGLKFLSCRLLGLSGFFCRIFRGYLLGRRLLVVLLVCSKRAYGSV